MNKSKEDIIIGLNNEIEELKKENAKLKIPCYFNGVDPCWVPTQVEKLQKELAEWKEKAVYDKEICPKCKMPKVSTVHIECFCASLENKHISQKDYDRHMNRLSRNFQEEKY